MKKQIEDKDWTLIVKHLGGELTEAEKAQLDHWIAQSDENRIELANAEKIWKSGDVAQHECFFDTDLGWERMHNRIHQSNTEVHSSRRSYMISFTKIAASFLLLVGLGYAVFWFLYGRQYQSVVAENQKILAPVILPDGTKVYLNVGAELRFPKQFDNAIRKVELSGEAFFEVVRNEKQPFIIQTPKAQIRVLGTSFNVNADARGDSVQVVVETGLVQLSSKNETKNITLPKGSTGVYYSGENKLLKTSSSDINVTAWKTNTIIFHDADLQYIVKTLNRLFTQQVQLEDKRLYNCRLNSDFKESNLETILKTIKELIPVEVKKTSNGYLISGPGC